MDFNKKKWACFSFALLLAGSISNNLLAQTIPVKVWDKTFGGSSNEILNTMKPLAGGGFILGGTSNSAIGGSKTQASKGGDDYWIVKLDANGNKIWDTTLGGSGTETFGSILETTDGSLVLIGTSNSPVSGDKTQASKGQQDYWVVKLDPNGNKIWDKAFGGLGRDFGQDLQQTTDGGFILGGYSESSIGGDKTGNNKGAADYWVIKLDAQGNKTWDKSYGGLGEEFLFTLKQTPDGGYIIGGESFSDAGGDKSSNNFGSSTVPDRWLVKLDTSGNKTWEKTIGGNGSDYLRDLQLTPDGGYLLNGGSTSPVSIYKSQASKGGNDFWLLKVDASGTKVWDKTYGGLNDDISYNLHQTPDGGFLVGGRTYSDIGGDKTEPTQGENDYWLIKLDGTGNKIWQKAFGGSENDYLRGVYQAIDGTYFLAGYSASGISGDKSQGRFGAFGTTDYWVMKLNGNISGLEGPVTSFKLDLYPNPTKGKFKLQLSSLTAPKVELTITNLLGRVILQKEILATDKQLSDELTLPNVNGVYLLQLKAEGLFISRKIVVE